jgi:hypothetical protein
MKTNMRVVTVVRTLAENRETKLGCAQVVASRRQPLAHLSHERRQQLLGLWRADVVLPNGKREDKPAPRQAMPDARRPRAGRLARMLGVSGRRLASSARRAVSERRTGRTLPALLGVGSARPATTRTAGFSGAIYRAS